MDVPAHYFRWSRDGKRIYFLGSEESEYDVWGLTLEDGNVRRMTRFSQRAGSLGDYALALDEEYLYFSWRNDLGDIWVMDVATDDKE